MPDNAIGDQITVTAATKKKISPVKGALRRSQAGLILEVSGDPKWAPRFSQALRSMARDGSDIIRIDSPGRIFDGARADVTALCALLETIQSATEMRTKVISDNPTSAGSSGVIRRWSAIINQSLNEAWIERICPLSCGFEITITMVEDL